MIRPVVAVALAASLPALPRPAQAQPHEPADDYAGVLGTSVAFARDVLAISILTDQRYIASSGLALSAHAAYGGEQARRDPPEAPPGEPQPIEKVRVTGEALSLEGGVGWALASWYGTADENDSGQRCIANCEGWSPTFRSSHRRVLYNSLLLGGVYWKYDLLAIEHGAAALRYWFDWRRGNQDLLDQTMLSLVRVGAVGTYGTEGVAYGGDLLFFALFLRMGVEYRRIGMIDRFEIVVGYEWGGNEGVGRLDSP